MSEPIHQLPIERMRKIMQKVMREENYKGQFWTFRTDTFRKWKRQQRINNWLYAFVAITVLVLIGWLVAGGCK